MSSYILRGQGYVCVIVHSVLTGLVRVIVLSEMTGVCSCQSTFQEERVCSCHHTFQEDRVCSCHRTFQEDRVCLCHRTFQVTGFVCVIVHSKCQGLFVSLYIPRHRTFLRVDRVWLGKDFASSNADKNRNVQQ